MPAQGNAAISAHRDQFLWIVSALSSEPVAARRAGRFW